MSKQQLQVFIFKESDSYHSPTLSLRAVERVSLLRFLFGMHPY